MSTITPYTHHVDPTLAQGNRAPGQDRGFSPPAILPPRQDPGNLADWKETCRSFDWQQALKAQDWYRKGQVNLAHQALDLAVEEGHGEHPALVYLDQNQRQTWSFRQMQARSSHHGAVLLDHGLQPGDRVFVFLPRIPELYAALMGVIRAGGIAGPLFEAFAHDALVDRLQDSGCRFLITNPELLQRLPAGGLEGLQAIFLLEADFPSWPGGPQTERRGAPSHGLGEQSPGSPQPSVLPAHWGQIPVFKLETELSRVSPDGGLLPHSLVWREPEDGYLMHYTSGSTGKPKGIVHPHQALLQLERTAHWVLDLRPTDVYWCTAHPGWVTGSTYGIFAPWLRRVSILAHGGRFDAGEWYGLMAEAGVTVVYSAPTAWRMLMAAGPQLAKAYPLGRLRHLLSVGEPLNPELLVWSQEQFGLRIHDTWWMTETGGQLVANLPSAPLKPGSMGRPLPGIRVAILDSQGQELPRGQTGQLAVLDPWPSRMREVWKRPDKQASYFRKDAQGRVWYLSGDSAWQDEEDYVFFQGREDDLIVSSGEKLSPFEIESSLVSHPAVAEAGVIGRPDVLRGSVVKAFVVLRQGQDPSVELASEIRQWVKTRLSAHAAPGEVEILAALPKTRASGKIMRRVLKAWETGDDPGDLSTLEGGERQTLAKSQERSKP